MGPGTIERQLQDTEEKKWPINRGRKKVKKRQVGGWAHGSITQGVATFGKVKP